MRLKLVIKSNVCSLDDRIHFNSRDHKSCLWATLGGFPIRDQLGMHSSTGTGECRAATSVSKVAAVVTIHYHCAPAILGRNQRSVTKQYATAEDILGMAGTSAYLGADHHTSYRVSPPIPASLLPCSEVLARHSND